MARLRDIGNIWQTIKELDVQAIREEAEQPVSIALVGDEALTAPLARLLREGAPGSRYPGLGPEALTRLPLPLARERHGQLSRADLLILVLAADRPLRNDEFLAYEKVLVLDAPLLVVIAGGTSMPPASQEAPRPDWSGQRVVFYEGARQSFDQLAEAMIELLPLDLRMAAARRLPGMRTVVARDLINEHSRNNAVYALTSGIPELIPVLNIPLVAADIVILTKNQALLVYRLALALGAPADFTQQMQEIMPVIGGGFLWRQLARQLVGLVPGFGLLPKVAVAYAGTYTVGMVAWRWYARHETVTGGRLRAVMRDAIGEGRERAAELVERYGSQGGALSAVRRIVSRPIRRLLSGRGEQQNVQQETTPEEEQRA